MSRNILITGGNSGIGLEMARALAADGDRVIIASSNLEKTRAAVAKIKRENGQVQVEGMALDLADFDAIDTFAKDLRETMPVVDVLILNAGLYTNGRRTLENGYEAMIGIMHFGHFRLTWRLLDAVEAADAGRIVVTSSLMHKYGRIRQASFHDPKVHRMAAAGYAQAKLANLLFTRALARRLRDTRVVVNAFHPGGVATGVWRELPRPIQAVLNRVLVTPTQGADTAIWLARAPEAREHSGEYFFKRRIAHGSSLSRDTQLADWLWQYSQARM